MPFASHPGRLAAAAAASVTAALLAVVVAPAILLVLPGGCNRPPPPSGPPAGTLEGRITDLANRPLADVTVEVGADPPDGRVPVARTRTSATGGYRVERVPPGPYRVTARKAAHASADVRVTVASGPAVRANLRLSPVATLEGRIEDSHGSPVPLAHVVAVPARADGAAPRPGVARDPAIDQTSTDATGRFHLDDLAPGSYRLLIDAPGIGSVTAGPLQAPDPAVVVVLPGESRSITGVVTHAGHPVPGARVHLVGEALFETRTTDTDASGRFAFAGVGPGTYATRAELGAMVSAVAADIAVGGPAPHRRIELALGEAVTFHGRVVDENGQGVARASVRIDLIPSTGLWPPVETDGSGRWTSAPVGPGDYQLRARLAGFTARRTNLVSVVRPSETIGPLPPSAVTLELVRSGRIVGRVLGGNGQPLANASVHDRAALLEELGVIAAPLPSAAAAASLPAGALPATEARRGARQALSDGAGRFELGDVPPGRLQLEILHPSAVPFRADAVVMAPGQTLDVGTVRLSAAARVEGRVVDEQGQPVPGARVTARTPDAQAAQGVSDLYAVTDSGGAFSLPIAPGPVTLTASLPGHADVQSAVTVRPGAATASVVLTVRGAAARPLAGTVLDGGSRPVGGARVVAFVRIPGPSAAAAMASAAEVPGALATTRTDAGGHFRFDRLPDGPLWLEIRHDSYPPRREPVEPAPANGLAAELTVRLPMPGAVAGEVHERGPGGPVRQFEIDAVGADGSVARFPAAGRHREPSGGDPFQFRLGPLAPGDWWLRVHAPGFLPTERQLSVPAAGALGEPSVRGVRIELERKRSADQPR